MRQSDLPPLIFPSSKSSERAVMAKLKKEGKLFKIGPRLYSPLPKGHWEELVSSNWSTIVSTLFPGVLLSHRTALEFKPSPAGVVYITAGSNRTLEYPGLTLKFVKGPEALESDPDFMTVKTSSFERALLENFSRSRETQNARKTLSQDQLESLLEKTLLVKGEDELNAIRDRAHIVSSEFGWSDEFEKLSSMIGALLGTRSAESLSALGKARAIGKPYDIDFVKRFETLFSELKSNVWSNVKTQYASSEHVKNKVFFESYFSNYIEGTTFELEEAEEIVFDGSVPDRRPKDAHDIIGTYKIVSDMNEMRRVPDSFESFERLLKERHANLMEERPEVRPGEFKEKNNRAGSKNFVAADYLVGTLERGFKLYKELPEGAARALYIMFLITEAHPFDDGNGRTARIFMNAELVSAGMSTIIIPNVYRADYLSSLRAMSRRGRTSPLIRMFNKAFSFSDLNFENYTKVLELISERNWFKEPDEAKLIV